MYMPWGKYRGKHISDIPLSYLAWVYEECDNVSQLLLRAIRDEMARRLGLATAQPTSQPLQDREIAPTVNRWFREIALLHHPDRGGDDKIMAALNDARDRLCAALCIKSG